MSEQEPRRRLTPLARVIAPLPAVAVLTLLGWCGLRSWSNSMEKAMIEGDVRRFAITIRNALQANPGMTQEEAFAEMRVLVNASVTSAYSRLADEVPVDYWGSPFEVRWEIGRDRGTIVTCSSRGPDCTSGTSDDIFHTAGR